MDADGTERVIFTETPEEGNPVVKFTAGQAEITSHSRTDGFGRKDFDELQLGTGFVSRKYEYHAGAVSEEHKTHGKLKSTPVTHLVSHITLSDGRTLDYEYDAEERITKVTDSVERVTEYTYDALGQLKTETVNDTVVNEMLYDNYGNIKAKNGVAVLNSPIIYADYLGRDAVLLIQSNGAYGMGHAAIIVEDRFHFWYYFSVGGKGENSKMIINSNPEEYHFYFNSCMTASSYALSLGVCTGEMASEYQLMLSKMTRMKIPNQVDNAINHFKHYYELTGFRRLIADGPYYLFDSSFLWGFY